MSKILDIIKKMGHSLISSFHVKSKTEDKSYLDANTKKGKELAKSMGSALREINSRAEKRKKEEVERIARLNDSSAEEKEEIARLNSSSDAEKEEIVSSNKPRTIPISDRKIVEEMKRKRASVTPEDMERGYQQRMKELYELKGGGVIPPRRTRTPRVKSTPVQGEKLNKSKGIDRDLEL